MSFILVIGKDAKISLLFFLIFFLQLIFFFRILVRNSYFTVEMQKKNSKTLSKMESLSFADSMSVISQLALSDNNSLSTIDDQLDSRLEQADKSMSPLPASQTNPTNNPSFLTVNTQVAPCSSLAQSQPRFPSQSQSSPQRSPTRHYMSPTHGSSFGMFGPSSGSIGSNQGSDRWSGRWHGKGPLGSCSDSIELPANCSSNNDYYGYNPNKTSSICHNRNNINIINTMTADMKNDNCTSSEIASASYLVYTASGPTGEKRLCIFLSS